MGVVDRRRRIAPIAALALLVTLPFRANATPVAVVTTPNASFEPGQTSGLTLEVSRGGTLVHANLDLQAVIASSWGWHAVIADDIDAHGQPIFASDLIGFGQIDTVDGVEQLAPGTYGFHCQTHGDVMVGELLVTEG